MKLMLPHWKRPDEITARFLSVVAIFVIIGICVLSLDRFQASVLSSIRAYVAGEGFYSKSQKDAVYHLQRYATSGDETEYRQFLTDIAVPLGDHEARLALQSHPPDLAKARRGFLTGHNHPDDIGRLVSFFLDFHRFHDMRVAIEIWTAADAHIARLAKLGNELHGQIASGRHDTAAIAAILAKVEVNNRTLATLENEFSSTLGATARRTGRLTGIVIISATLGLLTLGIILSRQIVRHVRDTQALLRESEARFRHVVESNIIGIMFWLRDGTIFDANDAFLDIIGYSRDDLGNINWRDMTPEAYASRDDAAADEVRATGHCEPYEKAFLRKDGSTVEVVLGAALLEASGNSGVCFVLDISERHRLQEQVEHAQRMEAIGTLVGGIAHDFNNTLSAMLGNIHLARLESQATPALDTRLEKLETLSTHSARIVQQLMTFARKTVIQVTPVSVNGLMEDIKELAETIIPENIYFRADICAEPLLVVGDETQLQQVVINLLTNARDAVAASANPRITCRLEHYRALQATARGRAFETDMAHLCVTDNGSGMSRDTLSHVFEPFYTTKDVGKGTGLGLSMAYGAVRTHGGEVRIDSQQGEGTSVHIYLPLFAQARAAGDAQPQDAEESMTGITVLLVDDNSDVRNICTQFLEASGQTVIAAQDGVEAIDAFRAHRDSIQLLVTDVVMPRMGGVQLAEQIHAERPHLPVIFITGYGPEHTRLNDPGPHHAVLSKPFSYDQLIHTVNEVLRAVA